MNKLYEKTSQYWNDLYENKEVYDPMSSLPEESVELALDWISSEKGTILDIGCGSGEMILRCLSKGAVKIMALDSSFHGISLARRTSSAYFSTLQTKWIWGNIGSLLTLPDACCQGVILANILEHLKPEEGKVILSQVERLLDHNGRVVIILNEFLDEESNLYLWHISEGELFELMEDAFELIDQELILSDAELEAQSEMPNNRLYKFQLKQGK